MTGPEARLSEIRAAWRVLYASKTKRRRGRLYFKCLLDESALEQFDELVNKPAEGQNLTEKDAPK